MDNYKRMIVKAVENNIREYRRLIEEHCALSDVIHKASVTSDYLRGLKIDGTVDDDTYNNLKDKIQQLSEIASIRCKCEIK